MNIRITGPALSTTLALLILAASPSAALSQEDGRSGPPIGYVDSPAERGVDLPPPPGDPSAALKALIEYGLGRILHRLSVTEDEQREALEHPTGPLSEPGPGREGGVAQRALLEFGLGRE